MTVAARVSLWAGIAVPFLYFGSQAAAAPFYPGYSFLTNSASQLGSDKSSAPIVLNAGAVLAGLSSMAAAYGFFCGLRERGVNIVLASSVALCAVSTGLAAVWAGTHPLPDPAHNPGALAAGSFAAPLLLLLVVWRMEDATRVRAYLMLNALAFAAVAAVLSGLAGLDPRSFAGLLQRIVAAILYLPPAVVAASLLGYGGRRVER
jgi:hypothetical protein